MAEILWNPGKAAEIGNLQGQMTGFVAGAYSIPGMANISAAPTEVLNQNGYTIYQDDTTGHYNLKRDNHTNSDSIWTSQTMGVTFDCSGDTLSIKGINEENGGEAGEGGAGNGGGTTRAASLGLVTSGANFDYGAYTDNARSSFAQTSQGVLNRLNASQNSGVTYSSTVGLSSSETIDPVTRSVVDKTKSAEIDAMNTSEANKHKFDNIAKLIVKTAEKQNVAEVEAKDKHTDCAIAGAVIGGTALSVGIGAKAGAAIGSFIPIPFAGTIVGAAAGAAIGWVVGNVIQSGDEAKAEDTNKAAVKEAQKAGEELKDALGELSEDELIAFQRYYYQTYNCKLTDVLKSLETDEDSSKIAQGAGLDDGYLTGMFEDIDSANETLKPKEDAEAEVSSANTKEITYSQLAQIEVLQQNAKINRQYWQEALQNGGTLEINGNTLTSDELSQKYIDANAKLEEYLDELDSGSTFEAQYV